jgi:Glycosyl hydrolase 36 superfamily, catalytic domain/Glycosyltransferase family 36
MRLAVLAATLLTLAGAAGPPAAGARVAVDSADGSGAFGRWMVDGAGLPMYRYTLDQQRASFAKQPELLGRTDDLHQIGNERAIATASNDGQVQLWSQDRRYQWVNRYDPAARQLSGGFGWLRSGTAAFSTRWADRAKGARMTRDFGMGYARHTTALGDFRVDEHVLAPKGGGPVLVHEVTIVNRSRRTRAGSWFEYWAANPYDQADKTQIGMAAPQASRDGRLLTAAQRPTATDTKPLSIFAAALNGAAPSHATDGARFFGTGSAARPAAVAADRLDPAAAPAVAAGTSGHTLMAFRTPWRLAPGARITLRYAYGIAHAVQIPGLVRARRADRDALTRTRRDWARWVPQIRLGSGRTWLSRELQWAAYTLRSGVSYEECRGRRILSQGGYYQYDLGFQGAFRDPLQHVLPLIYAEPKIARDVLLYSASEQPRVSGQVPYAMSSQCHPNDALPDANDMDLWLLWTATEYVLATRDTAILNEPVKYADGGSAPLWTHLKRAFDHQESLLGPHGGYRTPGAGDWSDFSTAFLQMTESTLVSAQLAYVYPRTAQLADLRGDRGFATRLRTAGARNHTVINREWTGRGWYSRGYAGERQLGRGAIFGEPQPWALLAGVPSVTRARTLVGNVRRFLTGVGAPAVVHGPARIGSAQSPASNDPDVTERSSPVSVSTGDNNAVFVGGSWYAVDGWLTWALGQQAGRVAGAAQLAFDELERNTLRAHANAYPRHWGGIISIDDVCRSHNSSDPGRCGIGIATGYEGQVMHQPAYLLWDVIKLAGVEARADGYRIAPHLPMHTFSMDLPELGLHWSPHAASGYVRVTRAGRLRMAVRPPSGGQYRASVDSRRVSTRRDSGDIVFSIPARAGRAAHWSLTATGAKGSR